MIELMGDAWWKMTLSLNYGYLYILQNTGPVERMWSKKKMATGGKNSEKGRKIIQKKRKETKKTTSYGRIMNFLDD